MLYSFFGLIPRVSTLQKLKGQFLKQNFNTLKDAFDKCCLEGERLKEGLKCCLQHALILADKILRALAYTEVKDEEAHEIEKFQSVLNMREDTTSGNYKKA